MYNNIFLLAFNPTNGICNESFFENTITLYPTNETGNIYFSNKIVDISSKKVLNEYKSFIYNTTKKIVDKNRNAKFILYNDKKRITDLCSNMLHLNIIQGNSTNIISNLNNKFYVREYLRNDVPMLNYIYFDKEHTISYHEICKIIKNNIFVAQTQNGAGVPQIRFHDLRHSFATLSLEQGMDIKTISHMLGHTDAGFTMNTYMHVTDTMQQTVANAMGNLVAEKENEKRIKIIQYTA